MANNSISPNFSYDEFYEWYKNSVNSPEIREIIMWLKQTMPTTKDAMKVFFTEFAKVYVNVKINMARDEALNRLPM